LGKKILENFFITSLEESASYQKLDLPDIIKVYLVALLVELAESGGKRKYDLSKYLFDLYSEALSSSGKYQKIEKFRIIGDISIIKLGFFPESINKKTVGPSYYRDMGAAAYYTAFESSRSPIYKDLSDLYDPCIDALHGVKNMANNDNIVELYEFWGTTNSRFAKRRLAELGFAFDKKIIE